MPLVECIPNVSEGRDHDRIRALAAIVTRRPDVHLLDVHQDAAHHRSVFTLVGPPDAVSHAAFDLVRAGIDRIDLRHHRGEHPRIGAVDVVPFVPLHDVSTSAAIALADDFARRIAEEAEIPVFLYGQAARVETHRRLSEIRRGGFEGLAARMAHDCPPDVGPRRPHPTAGATAVGVRDLLVAFNILLDTADIGVAREIARRVRTSGGGRAGIQALGFRVGGGAQVSMNLNELRQTTTVDAFDVVVAQARDLDVRIVSSEIVGLAPAETLPDTAERIALADAVTSHSLDARLAERYPDVSFRLLR